MWLSIESHPVGVIPVDFGTHKYGRKSVELVRISLRHFIEYVKTDSLFTPQYRSFRVRPDDRCLSAGWILDGYPAPDHRTTDGSRLISRIFVSAAASSCRLRGFVYTIPNARRFTGFPYKLNSDAGLGT